jgi:hypothetical protein
MFPAWEVEAISEVLEVCDGNVEMACEMIMKWTVDDTKVGEGDKTSFQ